MVMSFIDSHREELGIEPICRELAIAPSSYHEHAARLADPAKRSARARRDDEIKQQIKRVHDDSSGLYGTRKVWHQMRRSEEHTSELQSLMRNSYAVFCLKKKKTTYNEHQIATVSTNTQITNHKRDK